MDPTAPAPPPAPSSAPPSATVATPAHLGWRLAALSYDLFPVIALVFAASALMLLVRGGEPVTPESAAAYLEMAWLWTACGAYFVLSWRRGGQTLGMRPWRLRVVDAQGRTPSWAALCARYAAATLPALGALYLAALLPWADRLMPYWIACAVAAAGPLWSLIDGESRALYERWSGTRFVRLSAASAGR